MFNFHEAMVRLRCHLPDCYMSAGCSFGHIRLVWDSACLAVLAEGGSSGRVRELRNDLNHHHKVLRHMEAGSQV